MTLLIYLIINICKISDQFHVTWLKTLRQIFSGSQCVALFFILASEARDSSSQVLGSPLCRKADLPDPKGFSEVEEAPTNS